MWADSASFFQYTSWLKYCNDFWLSFSQKVHMWLCVWVCVACRWILISFTDWFYNWTCWLKLAGPRPIAMRHSLSPMPKTHPVRTFLLKWYAMEGEFGSEQEVYTLQVLHPACFAWFYWCLPVTRRRECCWSLEPHAHHSVVRPTWGRCDSLGDLQ